MVFDLAPPAEFESSPRRSVVAGAGGQSDDVEDVELEEDGDREKHGVDQEARYAQCPGQDESRGQGKKQNAPIDKIIRSKVAKYEFFYFESGNVNKFIKMFRCIVQCSLGSL